MSVPFYSSGSIYVTNWLEFVLQKILPYLSIFPYESAKQMEEINQIKVNKFQNKNMNRDVFAGATGATEVAPKF